MGRFDEYSTTSFLCMYLFFWSCTMVLSSLSPNQTNTMTTLSNLVNDFASWNSSKDSNPCLWKGVICDTGNSSVIKISLSGFSLSSPQIFPVVCKIETLEHLDFSNNSFSSIPGDFITECGQNTGLKLLNFSTNSLRGSLPTFHGFDKLESLDMSYNNLGGSIGLELDGLVSLKSLNLSSNTFSGSLPTHLGKSMVLDQLVLSGNRFEGTIPDRIFSYENLTLLDLRANSLSGSIPSTISRLSKLEILIINSNNLNGEIPITLGNITTLKRLAANENNFKGFVPPGITKFLTTLDLSFNNLSGPIPEDLLSPSQLQVVDLSNNRLTGLLPENFSSSLFRLRLGSNLLNGGIPSDTLATVQRLTYIELEDNHLTGLIPANLGSCRSLSLLNLAQNHLTGVLPPELGNLGNLQVLKLQLNMLNGPIPIQLVQLGKLSTLNLSWNYLDGTIPSMLSGMVKLALLNLQRNNLTGNIPTSIGSLGSLIELQLGDNQLSGVIPTMPPSLQIALNLSNNHFRGPIPSSLGNLNSLEVLDLSNNRFSGEIPALTRMPALTRLVLSNNDLSGIIPTFPPYVKVEYSGNKYLRKNTSTNNTTPNLAPRSAKKGVSVAGAILIAIAAAIFLVSLVSLLVVYVSRHYYRIKDEHLQPREDLHLTQVIQSHLLTPNGIHRSNIDFSKATEAVADTSNVTLKTRFSTYYKAIMPSGSIYFVKKLNWSDKILPVGSHDKFGKELEVLAKLNNSNVMTPLAFVLSSDTAYILYEFVSNGSLFDVLHGSMGSSLDWASRYSIAVGVAQGLSFLHGFASGPILLLDLSSKSIMLKSLKEPLVGDIEHYKVIDPSKSTGNFSAVAGSVGYIPPEYAYTMTVTMSGNVYSFGVILLELLTGKPAVTEGTELVTWVLRNSTKQDYILDFNVSKTSQAVRNQMLAILQIALVCVSTSPEARPRMKSVLRMILNAR